MTKIVTCSRVGKDLTKWAKRASQNDREELCEALDCGGGAGLVGSVGDTATTTLNVDSDKKLTSDVNISESQGNTLTVVSDGLYVTANIPESSAGDAGKILAVDSSGNPQWVEPGVSVESLGGLPLGNLI